MPMYEDRCPSCGLTKEHFCKMSESDIVFVCECGSTMERLFSVPAVQIFQEYTTNNINRDGSPVTVSSARQEKDLLNRNGLVKADGNLTK